MTPLEKQKISVTEFKAHCTEKIREVEETGIELDITRHGKVVATIQKPETVPEKTLRDWIGSGRGLMSAEAIRSFDEPTFAPEDWEEHPANKDKQNEW